MVSPTSLRTTSALQIYPFLKQIVLNIIYTDKSNITYNYRKIIGI